MGTKKQTASLGRWEGNGGGSLCGVDGMARYASVPETSSCLSIGKDTCVPLRERCCTSEGHREEVEAEGQRGSDDNTEAPR